MRRQPDGTPVSADGLFGRLGLPDGLGRLLINSVNGRDFPVVQSVTMLFATGFVVVNMLVDVASSMIDPRARTR